MNETSGRQWFPLICVMLAAATFTAFEQVRHDDFINYDDDAYVTKNPDVQPGFTLKGIKWAFTTSCQGHWHPLTWLSYMLDCQLFGLNPSCHHLMNLLLHIINTLLLFAVLNAMTAALWQSAFVAAAFALHPLHVQSVAWVAERKDVLSTLLWMLTMAAYLQYVRRPGTAQYLLVLLAFALGLMAKSMLVSLPFVLLLLDYWPLNRLENMSFSQAATRQTFYRLVWEKIPLFILTVISSGISFLTMRSSGVVVEFAKLPLHFRLANAAFSYIRYISKMFWPKDLAVFYPFSGNEIFSGQMAVVLVSLLFVSIRIIQFAPNYKYLPVGWFWYLGTLVPVIGIIQVGNQAFADRYTYVPLTGLFIMIAWGANDLLRKWRYRKIILSLSSVAIISGLSICTWFQTSYWRNSMTLFEHALKVTSGNYIAYTSIGVALIEQGRFDEAIVQLRHALEIKPNNVYALYNLGVAYGKLGRTEEEIEAYKQAIKIKPDFAEAYFNLGGTYVRQNHWTEAIEAFRQAVNIRPDYAQAHYNLGASFIQTGDRNSAMQQYEILKKLNPDMAGELLGSIAGKN